MKKFTIAFISCMMAVINLQAQFSIKEKKETIDSIAAALEKHYVFPEVAKRLSNHLRTQFKNKVYDTISSGPVFAEILNAEIKRAGNDKHLSLHYSTEILAPQSNSPLEVSPEEKKGYELWLLTENYGITALKVLPGNIGYVDFKWFCGPEYAGEVYVAMMNYVAHTDALIIDLRNSQGAMSTEIIPFLSSYFFEKPTHLNDYYWRDGNRTV